jgi:hypothetical protein
MFFGLFACLPDFIGLLCWNVLNAAVLIWAIKLLPALADNKKAFILWYVLIELIGSQQNAQSNTLMAGLLIGAFALAEKEKFLAAIILIVCSIFIKIFGSIGLMLFLFYPQKLKNAFYFIVTTLVFFLLPLIFVSFQQLIFLYKSWLILLKNDNATSIGLSIFGWLQTWFNITIPRMIVFAIGLVVYLLPLVRIDFYKKILFRYWILASTLLWVIIFNYKSESPTFIIAVAGVALWFITTTKKVLDIILASLVFVFAMLSPTDIFPHYIKANFFDPYVIKVVPCILVWLFISYKLIVNPAKYLPATL